MHTYSLGQKAMREEMELQVLHLALFMYLLTSMATK